MEDKHVTYFDILFWIAIGFMLGGILHFLA